MLRTSPNYQPLVMALLRRAQRDAEDKQTSSNFGGIVLTLTQTTQPVSVMYSYCS